MSTEDITSNNEYSKESLLSIPDLFTFWNTIIKEKNEGTWLGFKSLADFSLNNPDHIKELIKKQPLAQLKRFTDISGRNKAQVVESVYDRIIDLFNISGSIQWSFGQKYSDVIRDRINGQTEADFDNYIKGKRQAKKENEKALTNPETLDEFRIFLQEKKVSDLTDEQLSRYDALVAGRMKEMNQRQESRSRTIEAVDLGGIDFELKETIHTRKNIPLYVVVLSGRVEKDVFKELSAKAKQLDGYYSSFSKDGAIPGFQFPRKESAEKFIQLKESAVDNTEEWEKKQFEKAENRAESLRNKANSLISEGNAELAVERKDNTHRRAAFARSAEQRASSKIKTGNTLLKIANGIEDGSIEWLSKITSNTELQLLFSLLNRARWERIRKENLKSDDVEVDEKVIRYVIYPYPSFWAGNLVSALEKVENAPGRKRDASALLKGLKKIDPEKVIYITDQVSIDRLHVVTEPYGDKFSKWEAAGYKEKVLDYNRIKRLGIDNISQLRTALRELLKISSGKFISEEQEAELKLKELERSFIGKKIEGFFPTPIELAEDIVDRADIQPNERILEPNGGLGHVAEVIRTKYPDNPLVVVEINSMLVDALRSKGFDVIHEDFLKYNPEEKFDKIIMNPPFEDLQDIDHLYHAYSLLKPGGRIVSVMSANKTSTTRKKIQEFNVFVEDKGEIINNPEGAFKSAFRPTGVNTVTVVVDKPMEKEDIASDQIKKGSIGSKLSPEEKNNILKSIKDSYKVKNRPYTFEDTGSGERRVWLDNQSEYMVKSDITGQMLRWFIVLPDGKIAHPTEVYTNLSISDVKARESNVSKNESEADLRYRTVVDEIIKYGQIDFIVSEIDKALESGAVFSFEYDSSDLSEKNPFVTLKTKAGFKLTVPEYILQKDLNYLDLSINDLVKHRSGDKNKWLNHYYSEIDWSKFYNEMKNLSETQKEASEHAETFKKIEAGEIKTAEDLGESIAEDHSKESLEDREFHKDIPFWEDLENIEQSYIDTGETRIDSDYDPDDAEYNQKKVLKPIYYVTWDYDGSGGSNDINRYTGIREAYNETLSPGNFESSYANHFYIIDLYLNEVWIDSDGNEIEDAGEGIPWGDYVYNNESIGDIPDDTTIYVRDYGTGEDNSRELLHEVSRDLVNDLLGNYENSSGEKFRLSSNDKSFKKYNKLYLYDNDGDIVTQITLRISDHSYNPANNIGLDGYFISVNVINQDPTKGKFGGANNINFTGSNTYKDVLSQTREKIQEIVDMQEGKTINRAEIKTAEDLGESIIAEDHNKENSVYNLTEGAKSLLRSTTEKMPNLDKDEILRVASNAYRLDTGNIDSNLRAQDIAVGIHSESNKYDYFNEGKSGKIDEDLLCLFSIPDSIAVRNLFPHISYSKQIGGFVSPEQELLLESEGKFKEFIPKINKTTTTLIKVGIEKFLIGDKGYLTVDEFNWLLKFLESVSVTPSSDQVVFAAQKLQEVQNPELYLDKIEEPFSDCLHRHGINLEKDHHRFEVDTELRDLKTNKMFKVVSIGDFITLREVPAFKNALTEPDFSVSYNELIDKFRAGELQVTGFMDTEVMEFARVLNTIQHCWKMDQMYQENERLRSQSIEMEKNILNSDHVYNYKSGFFPGVPFDKIKKKAQFIADSFNTVVSQAKSGTCYFNVGDEGLLFNVRVADHISNERNKTGLYNGYIEVSYFDTIEDSVEFIKGEINRIKNSIKEAEVKKKEEKAKAEERRSKISGLISDLSEKGYTYHYNDRTYMPLDEFKSKKPAAEFMLQEKIGNTRQGTAYKYKWLEKGNQYGSDLNYAPIEYMEYVKELNSVSKFSIGDEVIYVPENIKLKVENAVYKKADPDTLTEEGFLYSFEDSNLRAYEKDLVLAKDFIINKSVNDKSTEIKEAIEGLETLLSITTGKKKKTEIQEAIDGLQVLLEIS